MNCQQAKAIDLVSYLAHLGYFPKSKTKYGYWYLSPLRNEKNPSFKVHLTDNIYYDHGGDQGGGTIIDFALAYHKCTITEVLRKLETFARLNPHALNRNLKSLQKFEPVEKEKKIEIISTGPIESSALIYYLQKREIPLEVAIHFFCEARYKLYGKVYYALGFKNDVGGYELRNPFFKGSSMPKAPTFFDRGFGNVEVIEGSFSFLSFLIVHGNWEELQSNFLILNSTSLFKKCLPILEKHKTVKLHLDNDPTGIKLTMKALLRSDRYVTASNSYWGYKDWNNYLVDFYSRQKDPKKIIRISRKIIFPQIQFRNHIHNFCIKELPDSFSPD